MIEKTNTYLHPRPNDVLCGRGGRGGRSFEHIGNKRFRGLVSDKKEHYVMSGNQDEKRGIATDIINVIKTSSPCGRFLNFNKASMQWEEIDDKKALVKTLQALREDQKHYKQIMQNLPVIEIESSIPLDCDEIMFLIQRFCANNNNDQLIT